MRWLRHLLGTLAGTGAVTLLYLVVFPSVNGTTVAMTYLLVPLVAGTYGFVTGIAASLLCALCFNFFFLQPVGTLTIHHPQDLVAFAVFLTTAVVANHLSSSGRRKAEESERRRQEVSKLYQISRMILSEPDPDAAGSQLPDHVATVFGFGACRLIMLSESGEWRPAPGSMRDGSEGISDELARALDSLRRSGPSSHWKTAQGETLTCVPLRTGTTLTGALVYSAQKSDPATIEALASLVTVALERNRILKDLGRTEALRQSDALKTAILAAVSHDLRTPLTSIMTAVENLLSTDVDWNEATRRELCTIIKEEVDRLSRVVQDLLDMARIEAGECRPVKERGSVSDMIGDVIARCSDSLAHHQVAVDVPEDLPVVRWDERLMTHVLRNLVENAAQYSPPGSEIRLHASLDGETLLISVEDQGPGIPAEEMPRIFERFYRGRAAGRDRVGTGMGLAIARGIIEAHGGTIRVGNAALRGARFTMVIPGAARAEGDW